MDHLRVPSRKPQDRKKSMRLEDFIMTGWKNGGAVSTCPKLVQKAEELAPDLVRMHPGHPRTDRRRWELTSAAEVMEPKTRGGSANADAK